MVRKAAERWLGLIFVAFSSGCDVRFFRCYLDFWNVCSGHLLRRHMECEALGMVVRKQQLRNVVFVAVVDLLQKFKPQSLKSSELCSFILSKMV